MSHANLIRFFLQIGVMLAVAIVFGQLARKLRQPAVLGELTGGVFLGPTIMGALLPLSYNWLFEDEAIIGPSRNAFIQIGMLFFLFVAGLEVQLHQLRRRGLSVIFTSLTGIIIPFAIGVGTVLLWPAIWSRPAEIDLLPFGLFIGAALSISALPVIARILMDLRLMGSELGSIIMTAAIIDDLIGWSLFALILSIVAPTVEGRSWWFTLILAGIFILLILGLGRRFARPFLHWSRTALPWPSGLIGLITVLLLAAAAVAEAIGVHAVFGAFLVGVALGQGVEEENHAHDIIHQFAISFFAPLFFVSVGLKADFAAHFNLPLVLLVLLIATVGKVGGAGLGALLGGLSWRDATAVGFGMNARGAMEMILASVALELGLIEEQVFVALIIMAMVTSMIAGPALQRLVR